MRKGRDELAVGCSPGTTGRSRAPGGGRTRAAETDETLVADLDALISPTTRGDPESPLRWTTLSTRNLAAALRAQGHTVSDRLIARLLVEMGYSLQGNRKTTEGSQHPDRDAQFAYLNETTEEFLQTGDSVISVDTKKKDLVGDFKIPELGKIKPYGVYDLATNSGWVSVGTDHHTPVFAVNTIGTWWARTGNTAYPQAKRLLITANGGGSNGHRP